MRTAIIRSRTLIMVIFCTVIAGCVNKTIISSHDYSGDKASFANFKVNYGKADWPEPEIIDFFDPNGTNANVIRYAHWIPSTEENIGVVVHFNGRTEFIEKNIYTYKDLLEEGFEVWALDWRGQGFSQRQIDAKQKHDIDSFNTYVQDAAYFINEVTNTTSSKGKKVLLAHSMGGQIALRYLLENPDTFDYAVLSSPLLGLPGETWYIRAGNWLKRNTFFASSCVMSRSSTWTSNFRDNNACSYVNKEAAIVEALFDEKETQKYSHDYEKIAEIDCLIGSSIDAKGPENPDLRVACPTTRWLYEAFASTEKVMAEAHKLATPVLIVRSYPDTAVDNKAQEAFCDQTDRCVLVTIPENKKPETGHELLVETEAIRKKFFKHFKAFVNK